MLVIYYDNLRDIIMKGGQLNNIMVVIIMMQLKKLEEGM